MKQLIKAGRKIDKAHQAEVVKQYMNVYKIIHNL